MPAPSWATPKQLRFLKSRRVAHAKAQEEKALTAFWTEITRDFFAQWPDQASELQSADDDDTSDISDKENSEKTKKKKKKKKKSNNQSDATKATPAVLPHEEWVAIRRGEINNWYNNHGLNKGSRRAGKVQSVTVVLQPPTTRVSTEYHLYSKRYYETRVKEDVENEIGDQNIDRSQRIAIVNKHLIQKYKNESEEIKEEIRAGVEKERKDKEAEKEAFDAIAKCSEDLTAEQYMIAQAAAPEMIKDFMELMTQRTGWSFSMLAGGPSPAHKGAIRSLAIHSGVNAHGLTYAKYHPNHQKKLVLPFSGFLRTVYPNAPNDKRFILPESEKQIPGEKDQKADAVIHSTIELGNELDDVIGQIGPQNLKPSPMSSSPTTSKPTPGQPEIPINVPAKLVTSTPTNEVPGVVATLPVNTESQPEIPIDMPAKLVTSTPTNEVPGVATLPVNTESHSALASVASANVPTSLSITLPTGSSSDTNNHILTPAVIPEQVATITATLNDQSNTSTQTMPVPDVQAGLDLPPPMALAASIPNINLSLPGTGFEFPPMNSWGFDGMNPVSQGMYDMSMSSHFYGSKLGEKPYQYCPDMLDDLTMMDDVFNPEVVKGMLPPGEWEELQAFINGSPSYSSNEGTYLQGTTSVGSCASQTITNPTPTLPILANVHHADSTNTNPHEATGLGHIPIAADTRQSDKEVSKNDGITNLDTSGTTEGTTTTHERSGAGRMRKPSSSKEVVPLTSNTSATRPQWLSAAYAYLEEGIENPAWKKCLDTWFAFEHDVGLTEMSAHRLPAAARPPILTRWLGSRKYTKIPVIEDRNVLSAEWIKWWNSLQPEWRQTKGINLLPLPLDASKDISSIRKGGPSGLVTVLTGLKWWFGSPDTADLWIAAVKDMTECFEAKTVPQKRGDESEEGGKGRRKKRKTG